MNEVDVLPSRTAWCEDIPMQKPEFGNRVTCRAMTEPFSWDTAKWGMRWWHSLAPQRSIPAGTHPSIIQTVGPK